LTTAAAKSSIVADTTLNNVASAAASTLPTWTQDDASKLLLALAKLKGTNAANCEGVAKLYSRACDVLLPNVPEFSAVQLLKVILAIGHVAACRQLLEAAGMEAVQNKINDLPAAQLLLLTQGLLSLGEDHAVMASMLEFWVGKLAEAAIVEQRLFQNLSLEVARERRIDFEKRGQCSGDQLAKLSQTLSAKVLRHASSGMPWQEDFWDTRT